MVCIQQQKRTFSPQSVSMCMPCVCSSNDIERLRGAEPKLVDSIYLSTCDWILGKLGFV